jgi:hypothetical protein
MFSPLEPPPRRSMPTTPDATELNTKNATTPPTTFQPPGEMVGGAGYPPTGRPCEKFSS